MDMEVIRDLVPNWLKIILFIASFLSFYPQLQCIWVKKDSSGISLYYILYNLISATEQFTLGFFYVVNLSKDSDLFVNNPRNIGDWLNLVQLTVVWLMSLLLFAVCLYFSPESSRNHKAYVGAIYTSFILISILPAFINAINPGDDEWNRWFCALFFAVHSIIINPIVTVIAICSLFIQISNATALSILGLASQAFVFALVALSWTARVRFPTIDRYSLSILITWYQLVGWATVDNAVFSIIQLILFYVARHRQRGSSISADQEPLLGH